MSLNEILLVCAALIPAIVLCVYVFIKDRVEKEPIGLLLLLLGLGVVSCFPAAEVEGWLIGAIDDIFSGFGTNVNGTVLLPDDIYKIYNAVKCVFGIALVEEGFKFIFMFFVTRNNKNFNSLFDGIIYSVFVSLGFAAYENVMYVLEYGWQTAIMRAFMSVPGHMFFAVIMGYYYSLWHMSCKARDIERNLKSKNLITKNAPEFSGKSYMAMCLVMPIVVHGIYDYCCFADTTFMTVVLYLFVIFLFIYCFGKIRKFSKIDSSDTAFANYMVLKKYPLLEAAVNDYLLRKGQDTVNSETVQ